MSYIHILYEIDLPFVIGLKEFANLTVFSGVFKKCGALFMDKNNLHK